MRAGYVPGLAGGYLGRGAIRCAEDEGSEDDGVAHHVARVNVSGQIVVVSGI